MSRQAAHPMLAVANHDEAARDGFIFNLKHIISTVLTPGNKTVHDAEAVPAYTRRTGHAPRTRHELRQAMEATPYHQMWGSLMRHAQEAMWDSIEESVTRQLPELIARATIAKPKGSLTLDPNFTVPRYLAGVDHHCMPGSYAAEVTATGDVRAGAIYDRGAYAYHLGARGELLDANGRVLAAFLRGRHPGFSPRRILDMGCSIGHMTTGLARFYPAAEVHAIDVGAAMLRYGHARAEKLGIAIQFRQANAENTGYPDGHFDLVVSSNLFHETSHQALGNILAETKRVLRPGGVMTHMEVPVRYADMALYDQVMRGWQTFYNAEPFWDGICSMDVAAAAAAAGLDAVRGGYVRRSADPINDPRTFADRPSSGNDFRYILTATGRA